MKLPLRITTRPGWDAQPVVHTLEDADGLTIADDADSPIDSPVPLKDLELIRDAVNTYVPREEPQS